MHFVFVRYRIIGEMLIITDISEVVFQNTLTSDGTDVASPPQTVCTNLVSVVVMVS